MERKRFSVLFYTKKAKLLRNGEAPLRVRITYDKQYVEMQLKCSIPSELWSQPKERATGRDRKSNDLNYYIDSLRVQFFRIFQEMELEGKIISPRAIVNHYQGKDDHAKTLYGVFKEHNDNCRKLIGTDYVEITIRRYDNCLKYLTELVKQKYGVEDMLMREVNGELVRAFEFYLKTEKGCAQNTVIRYMKCFKKVINLAIANEWITKNPFASIKFHEVEVNKEFLTQEEIETLMQKTFSIERLALVRDVFLFQIYTGLAFIDVYNLKTEHILKDSNGNIWIRKAREKTKNMCNIPLLSVPIKILSKYRDNPYCLERGVLLPVPCNQKMNSYLKEIADLCGIKKNLTTHTARHTFASTIALANNVSLPNVAKMLGHSNTRMTQHYAKVIDSSILREMGHVAQRVSSDIKL
jgi:site-specific recombinase XerD